VPMETAPPPKEGLLDRTKRRVKGWFKKGGRASTP
jgi:hypothetical protein